MEELHENVANRKDDNTASNKWWIFQVGIFHSGKLESEVVPGEDWEQPKQASQIFILSIHIIISIHIHIYQTGFTNGHSAATTP